MEDKENQAPAENPAKSGRQEFTYYKTLGRIALIFLIGLSFYLFISTIILSSLTRPDKEVQVPALIGKQFTEVYNSIMRRGLKPEIKFRDVYDMEDGLVLDQYPDSGDIVYEGSTLKLTVSRTTACVDIPNVVGIELPFALNRLRNLHSFNRTIALPIGAISYIPSDKTAANIVIDQSPKAGDKVRPERRINLLVSAGKVTGDLLMPDVTGQAVDLSIDLLLSKGLRIDQEVAQVGDRGQSGIIQSQSIAKGASVKRGDVVRLKVGYFPVKEHLYNAYERVEYNIDRDGKSGLYEAQVEDNATDRVVYSNVMKGGQKIDFVFHRSGYARVKIVHRKKVIKVIRIHAEDIR